MNAIARPHRIITGDCRAALAERCIAASTRPGDLVLDPFLGSGTTALAADRMGRPCIGIELNPKHADMARARVKGDCPLFVSLAAE